MALCTWCFAARLSLRSHAMPPSLCGYQQLTPCALTHALPCTLCGPTGHSALHWCAAKGHGECAAWLLARGAHANMRNHGGATPLHSAANNKQAHVFKILVLSGGADICAVDEMGDTPRAIVRQKCDDATARSLEAFAAALELHRCALP